jgi:hypothetical protein
MRNATDGRDQAGELGEQHGVGEDWVRQEMGGGLAGS